MPTGTLYRRQSDGRWCASLQADGRRRTVYGRTEAEARRKLADLQRQVAITGAVTEPGRRTVNHLLDRWLETAGPTLRPKTVAGYRELVQRYIQPAIGHLRLSKLQPEHLQALYAAMQRKGLKREPARVHAVLHRALKVGVLWRWVAENPADRVLKPGYHAPRTEVWSLEQARTFLEGTRAQRFGPLWALAIATGCRLGELLALRWEDVDMEAGTLTLRRKLQRIGGQWVEGEPKTLAGRRTVTLPAEGMAALRQQKARQAAWRLKAGSDWLDDGRVLSNQRGGPLWPNEVQRWTRRLCERLGLPVVTPHGLRHLHASVLLAEGVPLTDVSKRLGHANPAITATIYSHALPGRDRQAAEALQRALGAG